MAAEEIYRTPVDDTPLRAGECISNVVRSRLALDNFGASEAELRRIVHPFVLVVSQECDLYFDFEARQAGETSTKELPSVLMCEADVESTVRERSGLNNALWRRVEGGQDERYQLIPGIPEDLDGEAEGIPPLVLDFKRYFTLPTDELYARLALSASHPEASRRRAELQSPYKEQVLTRFAAFLGRVAVPEQMGT